MFMELFLSSIRIFFCKKTKNRDCSSVSLLHQCISNAMYYYTRRSSLTWLVLHIEGKICSVMWCAVQYSQHLTSITVLSFICFILKPFCNIDITYSSEIFHVLFFQDSTYMTHAVFSPLFSDIKRARQRAEADGKVAEVEGWLGRKGWQQRSLKLCCFSVTWRRPCHSSFFCLSSFILEYGKSTAGT